MRLLLSAALAAVLLVGCRAHQAYGPSSDERLESALSDKASVEGADVVGLKCNEFQQKFRDSRSDERPEGERLKMLTEAFAGAQERVNKLDEAVNRNPDLIYSADGETIKANIEECRSVYADVRSDLDRYIREIADLPIIQEIQGKDKVNVARLDFALVRTAITTLDPDDKDVLLSKIDFAEKKVSPAKK